MYDILQCWEYDEAITIKNNNIEVPQLNCGDNISKITLTKFENKLQNNNQLTMYAQNTNLVFVMY